MGFVYRVRDPCVCVCAELTRSRVKGSCSFSFSSISWTALCRREISTHSRALCSSRRISSLRSSVFSFTCRSFSSWYRNWCRSLNWASMRCFRSAVCSCGDVRDDSNLPRADCLGLDWLWEEVKSTGITGHRLKGERFEYACGGK